MRLAVFTKNRSNPAYEAARLGADRVARRLGVATTHYVPEAFDDPVGGTTRSPLLPNVPPMAEAGVPGYEFVTWMGLFAPLGTPREIVMRLNAEVARALATPDLREKLAAQAIEIKTSTPEELGALTRARLAQMGKLIKDAGIVAE